jgi:hypothetical protein
MAYSVFPGIPGAFLGIVAKTVAIGRGKDTIERESWQPQKGTKTQ